MARTNILFPVGRLVQGSLYKGNTTDSKGLPLTFKSGPNKGQSKTEYYFACAIAKEPGHTHWSQTEWGKVVMSVGMAGYPTVYQTPTFSWKIEDGDSTVPNKNGKVPSANEGWKGHWIIKFSGSVGVPRVLQRDQAGRPVDLTTPNAVKLGYFIQVAGDVADNKPSESPGVYMNYSAVLFAGVGTEIYTGPDVDSIFGVGSTALPAGALAVPQGVTSLPVSAPAQAPVSVSPNAAFLAGTPVAAAAPVVAPMPVPAPVSLPPMPTAPSPAKQMTRAANGATYEQYIAAGWNDQQLVSNGLMLPY